MRGKKIVLLIIAYILILLVNCVNNKVEAAVGVEVSNYSTLKKYLESTDGTEYHLHLKSNIFVTGTIHVTGTKRIVGNQFFITNTIGNINTTNESLHVDSGAVLTVDTYTYFDGNNMPTIASSNICVDGILNVYNCDFHNGTQGIHVSSVEGATCNFYSGTISSNNTTMGIGAYGNVNFYDGIIQGNGTSPAQGIHMNGGTLNMKGGTITDCVTGIYNFNSATSTISGGIIKECDIGVQNEDGLVTINGGSIYNNSDSGISNSSTLIVNSGDIYSNSINGILVSSSGTATVNGGNIYSNNLGICNEGILNVTDGNFYTNTGENGSAIYHNGKSCTITGGNFEADQNVYLATDEKYVNTKTAEVSFVVKPNSYTRGRKVIQTTESSFANKEVNYASLYPKDIWELRAIDSEIVIWDKGIVEVKYLDETGKELADTVIINDWVNEEYNATALDIDGYSLKVIPDNSDGMVTNEQTEVIFVYSLAVGKITIVKVDIVDENIKLKGAIFKLEKISDDGSIDNNFQIQEKESDELGNIEFSGLSNGKYRIIEVKAPEGYELNISETDVELTEENKEIQVIIKNKEKLILPETGGIGIVIFVIAGITLMVISKKISKEEVK